MRDPLGVGEQPCPTRPEVAKTIGSTDDQHEHAVAMESAERKQQRRRRRLIEPLHVVDRNHHRRLILKRTEHAEQFGSNRKWAGP